MVVAAIGLLGDLNERILYQCSRQRLILLPNVSQKNAWVNDIVNLYTPGEAKNWGVFEGK